MSKKRLVLTLVFLVWPVGAVVAQTRPGNEAATMLIARGNRSFAKQDYHAALREYESVPTSAGESYTQALYNIGVSYYELWRTADAIDFYRRAIQARNGHYPRASYALGVALEDQGQLAQAKEAYQQSIIGSRGEYSVAYYRLGLLLASEGEYTTAAEFFRNALKHPGLHVAASHNNLGVMLAQMGSLKAAQHEFEKALNQSGGNFEDAARNLKLCRSLLSADSSKQVAVFKVFEVKQH